MTFHAFFDRTENIGQVAANFALVDDAGQPACTGQYCQQRHLRQGNSGVAIVDQHQILGCQRQFVATACRRSVQGGHVRLPGAVACVFNRIPRLVGKFAEVDFVRVARDAQHADIGPGAEHTVDSGCDDHSPDFRMLEAQALHSIVQLDIDADIVGIQLELIAACRGTVLIDGHDEPGYRPINAYGPVPVVFRRSAKIQFCHRLCGSFRDCVHYNADSCYCRRRTCIIIYLVFPGSKAPPGKFLIEKQDVCPS